MNDTPKKWYESKTLAALVGIIVLIGADKLGVTPTTMALITSIVLSKIGIGDEWRFSSGASSEKPLTPSFAAWHWKNIGKRSKTASF